MIIYKKTIRAFFWLTFLSFLVLFIKDKSYAQNTNECTQEFYSTPCSKNDQFALFRSLFGPVGGQTSIENSYSIFSVGDGTPIGFFEVNPNELSLKLFSVSPNSGPITGQIVVTLTGQNFIDDLDVFFGESACKNLILISFTEMQCLVPPGQIGSVNISISDQSGSEFILTNGFTYEPIQTQPIKEHYVFIPIFSRSFE